MWNYVFLDIDIIFIFFIFIFTNTLLFSYLLLITHNFMRLEIYAGSFTPVSIYCYIVSVSCLSVVCVHCYYRWQYRPVPLHLYSVYIFYLWHFSLTLLHPVLPCCLELITHGTSNPPASLYFYQLLSFYQSFLSLSHPRGFCISETSYSRSRRNADQTYLCWHSSLAQAFTYFKDSWTLINTHWAVCPPHLDF